MAEFNELVIEMRAENRGLTNSLHDLTNTLTEVAATLNNATQPLNLFNKLLSQSGITAKQFSNNNTKTNNSISATGTSAKKAASETAMLQRQVQKLAASYSALGDKATAKKLTSIGKLVGNRSLESQQNNVTDLLTQSGYGEEATRIRQATSIFNAKPISGFTEEERKAASASAVLQREINKLATSYRLLGDSSGAKNLKLLGAEVGAGGQAGIAKQQQKVQSSLIKAGYTSEAQRLSMMSTKPVDRFTKSTNKATTSVRALGSQSKKSKLGVDNLFGIAKIGIYIHLIQRAARAIANVLSQAIDYVETLNLFQTALGEFEQQGMDFIDNMTASFGLSESTLMRYTGLFYQMSSSMGVANDQAYTLAENFTKLSVDLASYYNISVESANSKLKSALAGQIRPLRELGLDISKTALMEEARLLGITKSVETMTQAEKIQLRYNAIMRQSQNAQGDFSKTIRTVANQTKILSEQSIRLSRAWGETLMPVAEELLPIINGFVLGLTNLGTSFANVFGYEPMSFSGALNDLESLDVDAEEAADSLDNLAKATTGIDELNILSDSSSSDTDTGLDASFLTDLEEYNNGIGDTSDIIEEIGGFGKVLKNTFTGIGKAVETLAPLIKGIGIALGLTFGTKIIQSLGFALFKGLITPNFTLPLEASAAQIKASSSAMGGFGTSLSKMGSGLMNFIKANWIFLLITAVVALYTSLKKIHDEKIATLVADQLGGLSLSADEMSTVIGDTNESMQDFYDTANEGSEKLTTLKESLDETKESTDEVLDSFDNAAQKIPNNINTITTAVDEMTYSAILAFDGAANTISDNWEAIFESTGGLLTEFEEELLGGLEDQADATKLAIETIGEDIKTIYQNAAENGGEFIEGEFEKLQKLKALQYELANTPLLVEQETEKATRAALMADIQSGTYDSSSLEDLGSNYISSASASMTSLQDYIAQREAELTVKESQRQKLVDAGYSEEDLASWGYSEIDVDAFRSNLEQFKEESKSNILGDGTWDAIIDSLESKKSTEAQENLKKINDDYFSMNVAARIFTKDQWAKDSREAELAVEAENQANAEIDAIIARLLEQYNDIPAFANGGYIDGEIFRANEGGNIEAMGKVGGKTAVVNNQQIAAALGMEIYPAMFNAIKDGMANVKGSNGDIIVQIDSREIARATQKGSRLTSANFSTVTGGSVL